MAPEPARAAARFTPLVTAFLLMAAPAHALKVATWNLLAYENLGEGPGTPSAYITVRQENFRTIMAALDPDVLVAEELNSQAAADSFRLDVLGNVAPGTWSGQWVSVGGNEGIGIFYKSAKVTVSNVGAVITGGPRSAFVSLVKPAGYLKNGAWFRLYAVHLKAGNTAGDAMTRNTETTTLRNTINNTTTTVVGTNFMVCGDMNLYDGTEGAYLRLTESQANNNGRSFDYLNLTIPWHQNGVNSAYFTQCPCLTCNVTGQSGGGLDDRFDLALTSGSLQDGAGLDYVPGSYTPFGNDGLHFNSDINGGGFNNAVGLTVANALHDASDHLPVMITLQLPAKAAVAPSFALGDVIVGGSLSRDLSVGNAAPAPAAALEYTLAASAGFSAPAGSFSAAAGAANLHSIGMDAGSVGAVTGTLTLASNDNDSTNKSVALSGRVLDHARPSLDSLLVTTAGAIDLGDHAAGSFADSPVRLVNQGWNVLTARLALTDAVVGGEARFSIVGGFSPVTLGGTGATWNVRFDDAGAAAESTYTGTLTFSTADEALPGATSLAPVTVALRARVTSGNAGVEPGVPPALSFLPPRPNPFRGGADIAFELPAAAVVSLGIFDTGGRRVASLVEGEAGPGHHSVRWNARDDAGRPVSAGLYFVRFQTSGLSRTSRIALLP